LKKYAVRKREKGDEQGHYYDFEGNRIYSSAGTTERDDSE